MFRTDYLDSAIMAKAKPDTVSATPLFEWFKEEKRNRAKLRGAGYTDGRITNWRARGIPRGEVGAIAELMGSTYEQYILAAGAEKPSNGRAGLPIEEALAIKALHHALPAWRLYVLGLATIDDKATQAILLKTMRNAVPDSRVEEYIPVAPHAAARSKKEEAKK